MSSERFQSLVPWYVNGSLGSEERAWVDAYLEQHPESRTELEWHRQLQAQVKDSAPSVPATIGLARVMRLIQHERPTLATRVAGFFGQVGRYPAFGMTATALLLIQGGVILALLASAREDAPTVRALQAIAVKEGPVLKISFEPDAREADIRLLMIQVQGELSGGPGQLGDYYLRVPAGSEAAALARVQAASIVQAASLAPGLPPRE